MKHSTQSREALGRTLYPLFPPPNLPPACSTVSTVSNADLPVTGCMSVGMPRPSSEMRTQPPSRSSSTCSQQQHGSKPGARAKARFVQIL